MSYKILLFMWAYQPYFRSSMESRAREVLAVLAPTLDAPLEPKALVVGIRTPEKSDGPFVCVEPERGEWDPSIFLGCAKRAESIYDAHPGHSVFYGDEARNRDNPENIRRDSVRSAVREALEAYDSMNGTVSFCGMPTRVEGYHVAPILQFDRSRLAEYPCLPSPIRFDKYSASASLLESTINCLLREASVALSGKDPGRFFDTMRGDVNAILREAGGSFCSVITLVTRDLRLGGLFDDLNSASSLRYEGEAAIGELVFAPTDSEYVSVLVHLTSPIPLDNSKLVRKMVETTGRGLSCVCTGSRGITGLGRLENAEADNVIQIKFSSHYNWDMYYKNVLIMQSAFGVPRLPRVSIKKETFRLAIRRVFPGIDETGQKQLWLIVEAAMKQRHGTIIVVSADADKEAARLRQQAMTTEPFNLGPELVTRLSNIDGAILLDMNGVCHAIGLILDGMATECGDPSRGARYNSALRYVSSRPKFSTLTVVISDDGYVDMFPTFRPQVRRSDVEKYVSLLKTQNIDTYGQTLRWLEEHRFYLNANNCETVNKELARIHASPREALEIRLPVSVFAPNPEMDETYYVQEAEPN